MLRPIALLLILLLPVSHSKPTPPGYGEVTFSTPMKSMTLGEGKGEAGDYSFVGVSDGEGTK